MQISTQQIIKILYVVTGIIFIGCCVEAGGFIVNGVLTYFLNPVDRGHLWKQVDLSSLYNYDHGQFYVVMLLISIVAILKALMFGIIVKLLHHEKLNIAKPFSKEMGRFMFTMTYITLGIGLFSNSGVNYASWLAEKGVKMPDPQSLRFAGADVWLFMCVTLFVIAHIFKKGIEIQTENELTV